MVHVGVDLDQRSSQIAIVGEDGEISQQRLANDAVGLAKFFAQLPPQTPIAIEASGTWWWFVDLLEQLGHRPVLYHAVSFEETSHSALSLQSRIAACSKRSAPSVATRPRSWIRCAALR